MTTPPGRWPNVASRARDGAAEALVEAASQLESLVQSDRPMTETERLYRAARALAAVEKALRYLESVGACTRP